WVRLLGGSWAFWFYLGKAWLPVKLNMVYPHWEINPFSALAYVPALGLLAMIVLCWSVRKRWDGAVLFALGYYLIMLLPVLGLFNMYYFVYARASDHLQYAALIGAIALAVGLISSRVKPQNARVIIGSLVLLFG